MIKGTCVKSSNIKTHNFSCCSLVNSADGTSERVNVDPLLRSVNGGNKISEVSSNNVTSAEAMPFSVGFAATTPVFFFAFFALAAIFVERFLANFEIVSSSPPTNRSVNKQVCARNPAVVYLQRGACSTPGIP